MRVEIESQQLKRKSTTAGRESAETDTVMERNWMKARGSLLQRKALASGCGYTKGKASPLKG